MELDLMAPMAPSTHAQVALLSCSGIISLIWFRRAKRIGLLENTFLVISRLFVLSVFCFFLFFFYFCADLCSVSVYPHVWVITCHRHITFNQLPSASESLGTPVASLPVCQSSFLTLFITVSGVVGIVISSLGGRTPNEAMGCSRFTASGFPG